MATPDFGLALGWGSFYNAVEGYWWTAGAGNIASGSNPPYAIADFATFFPKFLGLGVAATASTTADSPALVLSVPGSGAAAGQLITGAGVPPNTTVVEVATDGVTLTLSQPATATGTTAAQLYTAPLLPLAVINTYIALASASLAQSRWFSQWQFAMALYVAHFSTLWLMTEGLPGQPPQQLALAAAQRGVGVLTSKSADGVSAAYQPVSAAASWGSWGLTAYGVQLVQMAKLVGMGGMWIQG